MIAAEPEPEHSKLVRKIVSGGQAGVDRAALDWAMAQGIAHGGWCPAGRLAEDGPIPARYALTELPGAGYRQRTRRNVEDSDATLILNLGVLDGGSLETQRFAGQLNKSSRVLQLDGDAAHANPALLLAWLYCVPIDTLNIAGPRESKRPGIYAAALALLDQALALSLQLAALDDQEFLERLGALLPENHPSNPFWREYRDLERHFIRSMNGEMRRRAENPTPEEILESEHASDELEALFANPPKDK